MNANNDNIEQAITEEELEKALTNVRRVNFLADPLLQLVILAKGLFLCIVIALSIATVAALIFSCETPQSVLVFCATLVASALLWIGTMVVHCLCELSATLSVTMLNSTATRVQMQQRGPLPTTESQRP